MNNSSLSVSELYNLLKRRKSLVAAAAMGVAGCGMLSQHAAKAPLPDAPASSAADSLVKSYTSDIENALDTVDRRRLEAARQAGQGGQAPKSDSAKGETLKNVAAPLDKDETAKHATEAAAQHAPAGHDQATTEAVTPAKLPTPAAAKPHLMEMTPTAEPAVKEKEPVAHAAESAAHGADAATHDAAGTSHGLESAAPTEETHETAAPPADSGIKGALVTASPMSGIVIATPSESLASVIVNPRLPAAAPVAAMGSMTAMLAGPAAPATEQPAVSAAEPSLEDAIAVLKKSIGAHPTLNTALALALLDGQKTPDADMAKMLSDSDQKVLTDLVTALDAIKSSPTAKAGVSQRAAPLLEAAKKWQADGELALPCLSLASRVDSYGVFTAVTPTFEQGRRHTVIIYCEVANFGSEKKDGWYTTRLTQQESLITDDNLLVWRPNAEEVEDRSLNQRHDFYLVKKLTLPETLAAGKYTLRMDVKDLTTTKHSLQTLEIQLVTK